MFISLTELNDALTRDPRAFLADRDARYDVQTDLAVRAAMENRHKSPIILLTGPSSSGKTTTAGRLQKKLLAAGCGCKMVSMDDYYLDGGLSRYPRDPDGKPDLESPYALDVALLQNHFDRLEAGESVTIPHFNFMTHARDPQGARELKLEHDDFVIFEGLHALNPLFTAKHPDAYRIYVQPMTDVADTDGSVVFSHTWNRLMRRCIRDLLHRNAPVATTLSMWASVRRGELSYICPYTDTANFTINTSHDYEIPVLGYFLTSHAQQLSADTPEFDTIQAICRALTRFVPVDPGLVSKTSLLREEFI